MSGTPTIPGDGFGTVRKRKTVRGADAFKLLKATLDTGDLRQAVILPEREDKNEWLAVNTVDFYNQINLLYGSISDFCTPSTCAVMSAGPNFEYLWADEQNKKPIKMSAPEYVEHLMSWVQHYLDDDTMFPSSTDVPFPQNFVPTIKQIFKRLFRVHFQKLLLLGEEAHLNTCFKHFYFFTREFELIETKELHPLSALIEQLTGDIIPPPQ